MGGHSGSGSKKPFALKLIKGEWGDPGSQPSKGISSYGLSANAQRPLAGAARAAVFNTWRRASAQILYIAPPLIAAYLAMGWAIKRNEFLNSKEGRMLYEDEE
ncbi:putative ubiquinol-cytochrome c reductase complex ubiquinone-binding protein [Coleophoma crateriformis]|uniref:Cytochrome b-c1 complex subunit 8 n=1 Tax=Coleophoma crateriformis TaxID=565419 RepID=A0A3D8T9Q2_9HELO|nr:putative ubiquinol-cytochrome c reductase complex ubiquinone-binding protein [Coleophoma crateriformis]